MTSHRQWVNLRILREIPQPLLKSEKNGFQAVGNAVMCSLT